MSQRLASPARIRIVTGQNGQPVALFWRQRREPVIVCNHWRLSGDWWRRGYAREYYRLLTGTGNVCTVYRDLEEGAWYLEKMLD